MQRNPSPISRTGALAALGGSVLVVTSMFMPWSVRGSNTTDFFHLARLEGVAGDRRAWEISLVLMLLMAAWSALYFVWRSNEGRLAWAFGGFAGAMMLYGTDLRISADIPAASFGVGEVVAAAGILVLLVGCAFAVAGNIATSSGAVVPASRR